MEKKINSRKKDKEPNRCEMQQVEGTMGFCVKKNN